VGALWGVVGSAKGMARNKWSVSAERSKELRSCSAVVGEKVGDG
jgi:hypothetical protein